MALDCEVALIGTGLAPLIAAKRLLEEGRTVLLLNPDEDYFRENSELSLDPFFPAPLGGFGKRRLELAEAESVVDRLGPEFPGAVELWPNAEKIGFRDSRAPHVRSRSRLWMRPSRQLRAGSGGNTRAYSQYWEAIEGLYVEAADAGLSPQVLEGLVAMSRFPGFNGRVKEVAEDCRAILLPKTCDVDVTRYRNGILEFVRERVGAECMVRGSSQIELAADGLRFHAGGRARTARISSVLAFWTPRLTPWLLSLFKMLEARVPQPRGVRLWEQWSLVSREVLQPEIIGVFEDMCVWAETEGDPGTDRFRLAVLRAGALRDPATFHQAAASGSDSWASGDSFVSIARLCHDFLGWDKFSIRAMRPRALLEWDKQEIHKVARSPVPFRVVTGSDGFIADVVRRAGAAADELTEGRA